MSFADDLTTVFGSPFGVSCTSGGTTANGILDEPTDVLAGDQVISVGYVLHCKNSDFGTLVAGDSITVNSTAYTVRTNEAGLDIIEHKERGKDIHLFVRKTNKLQGKALPFTYCGPLKFLDVNGNKPINVNFELEKPLSEKLRQEFLRV